ncbi:MAG: hypothetical protein NWE89_16410 [Candidatus Bathyarchaeota archaeon]|nr:hypothetical protein [Candidatus Bathyarchaeota archaeon]
MTSLRWKNLDGYLLTTLMTTLSPPCFTVNVFFVNIPDMVEFTVPWLKVIIHMLGVEGSKTDASLP